MSLATNTLSYFLQSKNLIWLIFEKTFSKYPSHSSSKMIFHEKSTHFSSQFKQSDKCFFFESQVTLIHYRICIFIAVLKDIFKGKASIKLIIFTASIKDILMCNCLSPWSRRLAMKIAMALMCYCFNSYWSDSSPWLLCCQCKW